MLTMVALLSATASASCAWSDTGADGTRRIIGFVDMEVRPAADPRTVAGEVVDIRTIGLSLLDTDGGTSLALGWQRHIAASLRDDALVLGNPLTALNERNGQDNDRGTDDEK